MAEPASQRSLSYSAAVSCHALDLFLMSPHNYLRLTLAWENKQFTGYLGNAFVLTTLSINQLIYLQMTTCKLAAVGFVILTAPIVSLLANIF